MSGIQDLLNGSIKYKPEIDDNNLESGLTSTQGQIKDYIVFSDWISICSKSNQRSYSRIEK